MIRTTRLGCPLPRMPISPRYQTIRGLISDRNCRVYDCKSGIGRRSPATRSNQFWSTVGGIGKRTSECNALPFPDTKESSTSSRTLPTARHSMGERGRSASSTQDRTLRAVDPRCYRSRSVASKGEGHSIQNLAPSGFSKPHFNFKQRTKSLEGPATGHSSVGWSANRYFSPSLVEMHFFQQLDKPRIGAKRVEDPIDL